MLGPTHQIEQVYLAVSDKEMMSKYDIAPNEIAAIDLDALQLPLTPEHIKQAGLGNCYFLSSLASIIRNTPDALKDIFKINDDGKIEITFYTKDRSKQYTYEIEPTKILKKDSNPHTHEAIFLLEKAYALHRLYTEPTKYHEDRKKIREVLLQCGNDQQQAFSKLWDKINLAENDAKLRSEISFVIKNPSIPTDKLEIDQLFAFNALKEANWDEDLAFKIRKVKSEEALSSSLKQEIYATKAAMENERKDYISALNEGKSADVFASLVGTAAKYILIAEPDHGRYLALEFLIQVRSLPIDDLSDRIKGTLQRMFGELNNPEVKYFIETLKATDKKTLYEFGKQLQENLKTDARPDIHQVLKIFFSNKLKWDHGNPLTTFTINKLNDFIDRSVPYKRGLGHYTVEEQKIYDNISEGLQKKCYLTFTTRNEIGQDENNKSPNKVKGLVKNHLYEIINCWERTDGTKFVLIRNPWDSYVRDYEYRQKMIDKMPHVVLHAVEKNQINNREFSIFNVFKREKSPRDIPVLKSAIPIPTNAKYDRNAYFVLELSDVCKRGKDICIAQSWSPKEKPTSGIGHKT